MRAGMLARMSGLFGRPKRVKPKQGMPKQAWPKWVGPAHSTRGHDFMEPVTGPFARSMQMQIVEALRLGDRRKASDLLLDFGHKSYSLIADDFLDIFKYCAQSPDPLFVMEIWRLMESKTISLNDNCFFLMTQALCEGGYFEEALNMMDFLGESQRLYPLLPLYNSFLRSCIEKQSIIHASKCLDMMEKRMVGKNEITYTELLKLAVLQKNLPAVHLIWEDYIKHYSLSIIPLRKFIQSFIRLGDLKSAYKTLQQMVSLAPKGNISIRLDIPIPSNKEQGSTISDLKENKQVGSWMCPPFEYFPDAIYARVGQPIVLRGNKETKRDGLDGMDGQQHSLHMKVLMRSFNDVIYGCAKEKNSELAGKLILQMQNLGLKPSSHTYNGFVRAVVSERSYIDGMEVLKIMEQNHLKPYDSTLATLSISCSEALQLDLAEALLNQITVCQYLHPYNAFLAACNAMNQPERAVRMLAKMKQMKLVPDIWTYELLFSLFGVVNAPYEEGNILSRADAAKRINAIERNMTTNGIQHSHISMKNLLKSLGEEGMIRELLQYLHVAENLLICGDPSLGTDMYNVVLHLLIEAKESYLAIEIFEKMKKSGCVDSESYNIMINCCSILRCHKSASSLLSRMIREGFLPGTCTYTVLIEMMMEDEKFYEAVNLLERVRLSGIQFDVLLFNTFLRLACFKGRIDIIEFIVEYMHREKVQPDPVTCGYVFSAYVNSGFHNTAIEALQVLSLRMMSDDGNILRENKKIVDEFILSEDSDVESTILKLFEGSEETLSVGLLSLRWCAIAGFPIYDSADQSLWAKRLQLRFNKRLLVPGSVRCSEE